MKNKLWAAVFSVMLLGSIIFAPASARAADAAAPAAKGDVATELGALVIKIQNKLSTGSAVTEESLAPELGEFDAILAKHKGEKSEALAQVLVMKAMLYLEILDNTDKAVVLLQQLKTEFPDSEPAKEVDELLARIDEYKARQAIKSALAEGAVFPDFSVTDLDGKPLSVAGLKGKVVLVDFWATWCPPCVAEMPHLIAAYAKYHDKGFEIIGISLDQSKDALTSFLKKNAITWPQSFAKDGWEDKLVAKYGIDSIPASFLVGPDGKIIARDLRGDDLAAQLEKLLGKK